MLKKKNGEVSSKFKRLNTAEVSLLQVSKAKSHQVTSSVLLSRTKRETNSNQYSFFIIIEKGHISCCSVTIMNRREAKNHVSGACTALFWEK